MTSRLPSQPGRAESQHRRRRPLRQHACLDAARRVVALLETLKPDEQIGELVLRRFLLGEPR